MDISNRIQELIRKNQLNAAKFADRIGIQRSNLSHVLTGRNKPGLDFIEKILIEFPDIDANWLISGNEQRRGDLEKIHVPEKSTLKSIEDSVNYNKIPSNQTQSEFSNGTNKQATVDKIIIYYTDNTFEELKK